MLTMDTACVCVGLCVHIVEQFNPNAHAHTHILVVCLCLGLGLLPRLRHPL